MERASYKICFLGYSQLYDMAKTVIEELPPSDVSYLLMDCDLDMQDECVREALDAGCEVFISGPGHAARFQNHYNLPLVEIHINQIDYALAIHAALKSGSKKVAVVRHKYSAPIDIPGLTELLGNSVTELVYETFSELFSVVKESDCDAIIGPAGAMNSAASAGKRGFLVYLSTNGIRDACLRAAELARELRRTRKNREITNAVMNNAQLGIIVTEPDGQISFFNRMAQNYTGTVSAQVRGHRIDDIFPNLSVSAFLRSQRRKRDSYRLIGGTMMRCVHECILYQNDVVGVLITMYPEAHNRKKADEKTSEFNAHIYHWSELTAHSESMKRLISQGRALTSRQQPTVICGEPGSGREEIAYCIHGGSERADYPCITLDLATIAQQDAAHVLFGYERGDRTIDGLLVNANHGSVVLKSISLAQPGVLACLQQVLNGRQILRPGMESALSLDIRFFTVVNDGELEKISPDLGSQISIQRLDMPPLRTRKEDIGKLFLKYLSILSEVPTRFSLTAEMEDLLREYSWPGNVWELRAVSTRYVLARADQERPTAKTKYLLLLQSIGEDAFFRDLVQKHPVLAQRPVTDRPAFLEAVNTVKSWMKYSNDKVAEKLEISRTTLWRLLRGEEKNE